MDVASGKEMRIEGLPQPLSLASVSWSPDQKYLALNQLDPNTGGNALWLVDVGAHKARKLLDQPLNTVSGGLDVEAASGGMLLRRHSRNHQSKLRQPSEFKMCWCR